MGWTHEVAATASVAAGALFVQLGASLLRRVPRTGVLESRRALRALGVWWLGIGLTTWANAGMVAAGVVGSVAAALWMRCVGIASAGAAMWGIVAYLAYVRTGRSRAVAAGWAYGLLVAGVLVHVLRSAPHALLVGDWTVDLRAEPTTVGHALDALVTIAFLLPPVVAGLLFLRLRDHAVEPAQRRRALVVGTSIPVWVLLHLLARLHDADAWQFLTRVLVGVAVALAVVAAYATGPRPGPPGSGDGAGGAGLVARVRELV